MVFKATLFNNLLTCRLPQANLLQHKTIVIRPLTTNKLIVKKI